ncbi:hypothetical protein JCM8547_007313 [Rhodosporidiobolus lusitaniae]
MAQWSDLPPELVLHILDLVLPPLPPFLPDSHHTLRSIKLGRSHQAKRFLEVAAGKEDLVERIVLTNVDDEEESQWPCHELTKRCIRMKQLMLVCATLNVSCLDNLHQLEYLHLSSSTISLSRPIRLPSLVHLYSFYSTATNRDQDWLLTPTAMPSLRKFTLWYARDLPPDSGSDEPDYLMPRPSLLPQLDEASRKALMGSG